MSVKTIDDLRGSRPSPEHVWCDECCRWEYSGPGANNRRARIQYRGWALVLTRVSRIVFRIGGWFDACAERAKIRDNRKRGVLVESAPTTGVPR